MTKKIIVSGGYGVGKSGFCVQWALQNSPTTIADFDILNPYFRVREIRDSLEKHSIHLIASHLNEGLNQDVPAMSFAFQKAILENENIIIDCAGSENGLRPLRSLDKSFEDAAFWMVLNLNRLESSLELCDQIIEQYETDSQIKVSGFIHNTHLLDETKIEMILSAQKQIEHYAQIKKIPIVYTMIHKKFMHECSDKIHNPLLVMDECYLRKEWMKGETL